MKLGRLTQVDIRAIWQSEPGEFTPWLAQVENIAALSETLRLGELQVEATERNVGRFSADIVARDDAGGLVLIENQLESTDHRHLGQVLTYLAGLDEEATIVWIATRFLEEHRAAVDWLNENTNDRFEFFGIELGVVRIGDSDPAPVFSVVAKPNDWSRGVRSVARQVSEGAVTDREKLLLAYWAAFADFLSTATPLFRAPKPSHDHWKTFGIGTTGFKLDVLALVKEKRIGAEIYISRGSAKADFQALFGQRDALERAFGEQLNWEELPDRKGSRISAQPLHADPTDESDRPRQYAWMHAKIAKFREVFTQPIKLLGLGGPIGAAADKDPEDQ
ncbi:MAG TPA: DUF4268 domain-containing protein [Caulobacteraceae bacterium]|jgi:hypothetical protein|nr:DUF4268 domain-containing protein [Caulobacteraceae bacterium]